MKKKLILSKLDVARRQLETLIRLYFSYGDPVSTHTLASASYNIIRDCNKHAGGKTMLAKDGFIEMVRPGSEKLVRAKINEAENFFKHADRDHDQSLEFNPDQTEFLVLEACAVYAQLTGEFPPLFQVYQGWFIANHNDLFSFPEHQRQAIQLGAPEIVTMGRSEYFKMSLPNASAIST